MLKRLSLSLSLLLLLVPLILCLPSLTMAQDRVPLTGLTVQAASTCNTANSFIFLALSPSQGGVTFTVKSNPSANTVSFFGSADGQTTAGDWVAINVTPSTGGATVATTTTTGPAVFSFATSGYTHVCMEISTLVAGTTTVSLTAGTPSASRGSSGGTGTIAIPATVSGATSGGIPCFDSATDMNTSVALGAGVLPKGGGAGACVSASSITDNGSTITTSEAISSTSLAGITSSGLINANSFGTYGRNTGGICKAVGTSASPSVVSCGSAAAGLFSCATNASGATCVINTTIVDTDSSVFITQDTADGTVLGVTCNTASTLPSAAPILASKSNGTSFTLNMGTITANPACFEFFIIN